MLKKLITILTVLMLGSTIIPFNSLAAPGDLTLFTPYTGLSVTPGESVTYNVDVINAGSSVQNVSFEVKDLPTEWSYSIKASGNSIRQLSIKPKAEEQMTLEINVPLQIEKGDYRFQLVANGNSDDSSSLPFLVTVSEEGTFKTAFTTDQPNMEGHADANFSYTTHLKNHTAEKQRYAIQAQAPEGWNVQFKSEGNSVTSIEIEPNESKEIQVDVTPAENVTADTYPLPIIASSGGTSAELELEAVITGKHSIELSTPDGKVSTDVTAGSERTVELVVKNTGSADLHDIKLSASTPPNWESSFDHDTITTLAPGKSQTIKATLSASNDAIAGDYVTTFTARTAEVSSEAPFRISVKTSTLWGLVGVAIILIVAFGLYYIVKKYGRR